MNRFLGSNKNVVISLYPIDRLVKIVQVRLKEDFYSEGLVHQTLNSSTHYVYGLFSHFLVAVYFLEVGCDLLLDQKNFFLLVFNRLYSFIESRFGFGQGLVEFVNGKFKNSYFISFFVDVTVYFVSFDLQCLQDSILHNTHIAL